ncbi:hypothetical protein HOS16_gp65 [Shigella phage vB_SflS-ISF001]|uniref:Uncharacterized protein n=1 Tax=Shigella phage vB_SflS-ISF001 TaxID=2048005 RepID=A0A2D1GQC7_9CAUD|nr:hypothetical protein HOS16_gp65 [Shigella phage vB_SflS-ISF001]ATN94143.1 hypothetical protein FLXISF001_065 [Shigella phage vB_SflS-ISF001]
MFTNMFDTKVMDRRTLDSEKQEENNNKIADAVTGKVLISVNLNTIGPTYDVRGLSKKEASEKVLRLIHEILNGYKITLKMKSLEVPHCELMNITKPEGSENTDVVFIVE